MESKRPYKSIRFPSVADALAKRIRSSTANRHEKRLEFFWGAKVNLEQASPVEKKTKKNSRAEMLEKWKAEKRKKLEEEKKKQKPIFKVGIVHRKVTGSPVVTRPNPYLRTLPVQQPPKDVEAKRQGVLTRGKARNMGIKPECEEAKPISKTKSTNFCKIEAGKKKKINSTVFKVPETVSSLSHNIPAYPYSQKVLNAAEKIVNPQEGKVKAKESEAGNVKQSVQESIQEESRTAPAEVNLQLSPKKKENKACGRIPIVYSPLVAVRTGRKSQRLSKKRLSNDREVEINEEKECRIASFRNYVEGEKKRLLAMCDNWKSIYEEVPPDVKGDIDCVVGKTNLLASGKFLQFESIIEKCKRGDPLVKIDDLQGFKDWVSIEVERIDEEFRKMEKLKLNDWKSETETQKVKVVKNCPKKPVVNPRKFSRTLAARKLQKDGNSRVEGDSQMPAIEWVLKAAAPKRKESLSNDLLNLETKSSAGREGRSSGVEVACATQENKLRTPFKVKQKSPLLTYFEVAKGKEETSCRSITRKTPKTANSSAKSDASSRKSTGRPRRRGLSEKYFHPAVEDDFTPVRTILGNLSNLTPAGMKTRSRSRQQASFAPASP